ncbi:MAG: ribonuclease HII [Bacteriovoracaceae bacterium]|nr:ribonuclease HII [Bacteriovoracaceae bacterium]
MIELKLISDFPQEIIAVDEVGRSPLSGPVVIGAIRVLVADHQSLITLLRSLRRNGVKDSKLLSSASRKLLLEKFQIIQIPFRQKGAFYWKGLEINFVTWEMDHEVIDSENIFQTSMRGMKEAAQFLSSSDKTRTTVLIDGHMKFRWKSEAEAWKEIAIIKGDVKSSLIGLAAIMAKEKRDDLMRQMHELYPHYGFQTNFGYPTREHRLAIEEHGPCPIHRKTFNKVKEFIHLMKNKTEEVG